MKTLIALVATKFRGAEAVALLASLPQGEPLSLVRERGNKFDGNAVQVWAREMHIGYLKGTQNRGVARTMDNAKDRGMQDTIVGKLAIDGGKQPMVEVEF